MHIGLVIYGSLDTVSGGYLYGRKLVEHLRQSGDQVDVIALPWRGFLRSLVDNFSPRVREMLVGFQGELLLQDELTHPSLFWLNRQLKTRIHYPVVSIVHHLRYLEPRPAWRNSIYRQVEQRYLDSIDGFIFNSQHTCQTVRELRGNLDQKPYLIAVPGGDQFQTYSGFRSKSQMATEQSAAQKPFTRIDQQIVHRAASTNSLRVIFLGNLIPRKGLPVLLQAIAALPPRVCTLTIAGDMQIDPAHTRQIQRQIDALGLRDRVRILGAVSPARLAEELPRHNVLAVPSWYEGYGIVYLEGMAFGLPAIATTSGAAAEIITDGLDGWLIPPGDAALLSQRLAPLASDRILLAEMGQAARRRYAIQPTWNQTAAQVRIFLRGLLKG